MRILFTGGGTGGHIYPIVAVTEELQKIAANSGAKLDLRYFGVAGIFRKLLVQNGVRVSNIFSSKLRRYPDIQNVIDLTILLPLSFIQALWKVFWFMPEVLFSKGGPGSLPVVLACKFYRVPVIIHDSDSVLGLSNRLAARFADRIAVSFDSTAKNLANSAKLFPKIALIGNPVRPSLFSGEVLQPALAKRVFGFSAEKPVILVIGGSQGAVKINDFMMEMAEELIKNYQILHQTGIKNFENVSKELGLILKSYPVGDRSRYKLMSYFEKDLKDAYTAADVIISRASSGSIFEAAIFSKPSILIPLPQEVGGEHQTINAYEYAKTGAAIVIEQPNLEPNIFLSQLTKIFSEQGKLGQMSAAAKSFSKPEAAKMIAEEIIKLTMR